MSIPRPFDRPISGLLLVVCLLLPQTRQAIGQESVPAEPAAGADDLAAMQIALDELPSLSPLEQGTRAAELVETYYDRYDASVDSPEFERIRDLKELLDGLDRLPKLTTEQQAAEADALIADYSDTFPGFAPLEGLKHIRSETEAFAALRRSEQQVRDAAGEWARHYWQSRCCPLPVWDPPRACLRNDTDHNVLYEQCLDGIHTSRWSGPYRLAARAERTSPHPFYVRYLSGGTVHMIRVMPGEVYAFHGSPIDGTLTLTPGYLPTTGELDTAPAAPPAPAQSSAAGPSTAESAPSESAPSEPAPSEPAPAARSVDDGETLPMLEGPMIAP